MRRFLTALAALALLAAPAQAQMSGWVYAPPVATSFTGALDIKASPTVWYGLMAASAADRGTAVANVCNASDVTCADVSSDATTGLAPNQPVIGGTTCDATDNCTVKTVYDKSGNACNATQATIASRPTWHSSAIGGNPAMKFAPNQNLKGSCDLGGVLTPYTFAAVAERTGNTSAVNTVLGTDNTNATTEIYFFNTANTVGTFANASLQNLGSVADSAPHALQGVNNGGSSSMNADGSSASGTNTGSGLYQHHPWIGEEATVGNSPMTGYIGEAGLWPLAFSGGDITSMNSNQHTRWGF